MIKCLECNTETKNKKFCSCSCSATYKAKKKAEKAIEKWLSGEFSGTRGKKYKTLSRHVRRYILNIQNNTCALCGNNKWMEKDIPLELHHIDGDWTNNSRENIEALCPNCHTIKDNEIPFSNISPSEYRTKQRETYNYRNTK